MTKDIFTATKVKILNTPASFEILDLFDICGYDLIVVIATKLHYRFTAVCDCINARAPRGTRHWICRYIDSNNNTIWRAYRKANEKGEIEEYFETAEQVIEYTKTIAEKYFDEKKKENKK